MDIRNDRQKGLNYTEIGKKYHLDPRTAKRYALSERSQRTNCQVRNRPYWTHTSIRSTNDLSRGRGSSFDWYDMSSTC